MRGYYTMCMEIVVEKIEKDDLRPDADLAFWREKTVTEDSF